ALPGRVRSPQDPGRGRRSVSARPLPDRRVFRLQIRPPAEQPAAARAAGTARLLRGSQLRGQPALAGLVPARHGLRIKGVRALFPSKRGRSWVGALFGRSSPSPARTPPPARAQKG